MISAIIATHQRAEMLDEALSHLVSQKNVQMEIIVLNDNEHDRETDAVIEKYPNIIYIKNRSFNGPNSKRKYAYNIAKGEYLYIPDDDDYLTDDCFFSKCVSILDADETISFVSGNVSFLYEYQDSSKNTLSKHELNVKGRVPSLDYIQHFQEKYDKPISVVATIFRKKAFDKIGLENITEFTDSSQYLISLLYGDAYVLEDDVAVYRIKDDKSSYTYNLSVEYIVNVLKQREDILRRVQSSIPEPRTFWERQYLNLYSFSQNSNISRKDMVKLNLWGIIHAHGSLKIVKKATKNILKIILNK